MVLYMYTGVLTSNLMHNDREDIIHEFIIHLELVALSSEYSMPLLLEDAENSFHDALEARNDTYTIALSCIPQLYAIQLKAYERLRNIIIGQIRLRCNHRSSKSKVKMLRNAIEAFPQFAGDLAQAALFGTSPIMCDQCRVTNSFDANFTDVCHACSFYRVG